MREHLRARLLISAPGLALAAGAVAVALESPDADRLFNATLAGIGLVLVWSVAVAVRLRYPQRPLGLLLFLLAGVYALQTLVASPNPYLFTLARGVRPAVEVLLIWVMLAFPSGYLQGRADRTLITVGALTVLLLWIPDLMLSPKIPMAGVFVRCQGDCPRNVLFWVDWPAAADALHIAFRVLGTLILVGTALLLFLRLRQATPLMRRSMAPVVVASIARVITMAGFLATNVTNLAQNLTFWAIPLAIALGLLRGRLYVAKALQRLVTGLRERPNVHDLRRVMAEALDDPSLSVAYWLKDGERWVDVDGQTVALPYPMPTKGRATKILLDAEGRPVAALVHDDGLLEEPALIDAVASSMQAALASHRLDAELKASRAHMAVAVEEERHRIERDLHDGAQQRLIAMRMKLGVTQRLLEHDPRRAAELVGELGSDVDAALADLRALAHGIAPPLLVERGLSDALEEVAQRAAIPVHTQIDCVGRLPASVERAIYFCCLEALQNAAKHAGPTATVGLTLRRVAEGIEFSVVDDGATGPGTAVSQGGQGLRNMAQRIEAVGGQLQISQPAGGGFSVLGRVRV